MMYGVITITITSKNIERLSISTSAMKKGKLSKTQFASFLICNDHSETSCFL